MKSKQAGNAILIILIAVFLFGALAAVFMRGARTGQSNLTAQQTKLVAQQIIEYGALVTRTVDRLRQKGCSESQLNFRNNLETLHVNISAPSDGSCDVFSPGAGGIQPLATEASWFATPGDQDVIYFTSSDAISGIGTSCSNPSCSELSMNLWVLNSALCTELNRQVGNNFTAPPISELYGCPFEGTYDCSNDGAGHLTFTDPNLVGKSSACYEDPSGLVFNFVLLER